MTPFGSPVVPEVNGRYITWFASLLTGVGAAEPVTSPNGIAVASAGATRKHPAQEVATRQLCEEVMPIGVGPVTRLGDQRGGAHPFDQPNDFADRMVAVQRRTADIAVARAGEQGNGGLYSARQPNRDALAWPDAAAGEVGGQPVGGIDQRGIGQPPITVAYRKGARRRPRLPSGEAIDRLVAPKTGGGIGRQPRRVQ